ncbi:MAG: hypothetical protein ACFHWX_00140 [Bacteroidota bacterium]
MKNTIAISMIFITFLVKGQEGVSKFQLMNDLIGEWEGTGWVITQERQKRFTRVNERLTYKLDSSIIYIEGKGINIEDGKVVHDAIGIVHLDPNTSQLMMMAFTEEGRNTLTALTFPTVDSFEWLIQLGPAGTIRYTAVVKDGTWIEAGSYSRDGDTWNQFFEMTLRKKS